MSDPFRPSLPVPTGSPEPDATPRWKQALFGTLLVGGLLVIAIGFAQDLHSEATKYLYGLVQPNPDRAPEPDEATPAPAPIPDDWAIHPDVVYGSYFGGSVPSGASDTSSLVHQFQNLLDLFRKRQGVDDNFSMRVIDNRTGTLLDVHTLAEERAAYRRGDSVDWRAIDRKRRKMTRKLVDRYEARGIPREAITVKWGRANQVEEAHERDEPFFEYETRLARYLGFSLLPTELGTVETFNQDHLVSSVGARGRYQMMPWILRRSGIHRYRLATTSGASVRVREELHPLLTMEPAFLLMRGYANAVGHEIPGLSAYHTGPGNIYKLYRLFLTESDNRFTPSASVVDAYMWAVTEGYDLVSDNSTFGPYSRGYIASAYGALRATDHKPVNTSKSLRTARVQVERGSSLPLSEMLNALADARLDWGTTTDPSASVYDRFRALNPHIDLPASDDGSIPSAGDVRFVASVQGKAVRFFLPLSAPEALRQAGIDALDEAATFRFDASTYRVPNGARTKWDRAYDALVHDIGRFGFTQENREQLLALHEQFEALANANPTRYRQRQLQIIETHRRIWMSNPWEHLADVATRATGRRPMPVQPPITLDTSTPPELSTPR